MRLGLLLLSLLSACAQGEYAPFKLQFLHGRTAIQVALSNPSIDAGCPTLAADQHITWNGTPLPASQQAWVCTASADFAVRTIYFLQVPNPHEYAADDIIELEGVFKARFPRPEAETRWLSPADGVAHAGDELNFELRATVGTPRKMNGFLVSPTDASIGYFARHLDDETYKIETIPGTPPHPLTRFQFETEFTLEPAECSGVLECTGTWFGPVGGLNLELKSP